MGTRCCFFGGGAKEEEEPVALDDLARVEELRQRLSGIVPPVDVDWSSEATINLSGLSGSAGHAAASPLGTFERRQSMRLQGSGGEGLQWTSSRKLLEAAIAMEQLQPMTSIPEDQAEAAASAWGGDSDWAAAQAGEQRLQGRLYKLKLEHCIMDGDGNCQFRAISHGLYGTPRHHAHVRRQALAFMQQHPQDFAVFLGEDWDGYLAHMSRLGTWGDELTLRAICEALAVVVNVISSDEANWFLRYIPRSTRPQHECFVTYVAPVHYNAVRRQKTGDRLRRSFGRQHSELERAVSGYRKAYGIPEQPHHLAAAGLVG